MCYGVGPGWGVVRSVGELEKDGKDKDIHPQAYATKSHLWQAGYLFVVF